jgi:hypothetical protein
MAYPFLILTTAHGSRVSVDPLLTVMSKVTTCGLAAAVHRSSAVRPPSWDVPGPVGMGHVLAAAVSVEPLPPSGESLLEPQAASRPRVRAMTLGKSLILPKQSRADVEIKMRRPVIGQSRSGIRLSELFPDGF